ncbi:MAG: hypothetical protein WCA11_17540, partial [Terracidiphilus sp.]
MAAIEGGDGARPGSLGTGSRSLGGGPERAVLVGVDLAVHSRNTRTGQADARLAATRAHEDESAEDSVHGGSLVRNSVPSSAQALQATSPGLDAEESLAEFKELVRSAGGEVAAELMQRRARPDPATLVGAGKVEEIAGVAASTEADLVLFDHDLTPTQLRNLEAALPCRVLDRTQLILDIFARHART